MPRGFCRTASGFRAWVRVSSHQDAFDELRTKRFTGDATTQEIRTWRTDTRNDLRRQLDAHRQRRAEASGEAGEFSADASQYLEAVRALTTYAERARDIGLWIAEFGDRPRPSIKPHEIRTVRDRWLTVGPRRCWRTVNGIGQWIDVAGQLSGSTVNHRLRALSNLWTVLDGKHAPNPVREVPEADEANAIPRDIGYDTIRRILDAMPDRRYARKLTSDQARAIHVRAQRSASYGAVARDYGVSETMVRKIASDRWKDKAAEPSLTKIVARCMAWSGVTPKELNRILATERAAPESAVRLADQVLVVPPRRKGRGAPGRLVPLGPDAVEAFRDLLRHGAHTVKPGAALRAWQRGSRRVLGYAVRLYDLRHSFVTGVVRATKNLTTAQLLAGHQDPRTTQRYALAALLPTLQAGIDAFTQSVTPKEET